MSGLGRSQGNDHPSHHMADSGPSPVASTSSQPNTGTGAVVCQGRLQLGCEGAASRQQKVGPGSLHWSPEHSLLSSSGVIGKVAASTSKQEREQVGWVLGQGDMRESFPNLHHDSEM